MTGAPVDDFIAGAGDSVDEADRLLQIGLLLSLTGLIVAAGVVAFAITVLRARTEPPRAFRIVVILGGLLALVGAALEVAGVARLVDVGWFDALTVDQSGGPLLRLIGGALLLVGVAAGATPSILITGALAGTFSFAFDGHTVSRGPRAVHALVNVVHASAGAVWVGGVVALAIVAVVAGRDGFVRAAIRFSPIATVALVAVAVAGVAMSIMIVDGPSDYVDTTWGRTLLVKLAGVAVAVAFGAQHHFRMVPRLESGGDDPAVLGAARRSLSVEAVVLCLVAVVTAVLARATTT